MSAQIPGESGNPDPREPDDTVVVNDETVVASRQVSDETVVAPRAASDATVVVARPIGDDTVAVARQVSDETVVVPSRGDAPAAENDSDRTLASPSRRAARRGISTEDSGPVAPPVPEPADERSADAARRVARGRSTRRDPARTIAPVPGATVWDSMPMGETGLTQGLPVVYSTRPEPANGIEYGPDTVERMLGPAPAAAPVRVREGRTELPSFARRSASERITTLLLYAGAVVVSVCGLYGIAKLAFGW